MKAWLAAVLLTIFSMSASNAAEGSAAGEATVRLAQADSEATIAIPVPGAGQVDSQRVTYRSLAVLTIGEVIAASGARYAGGRYVWWSRGMDEASLEDVMAGEDAEPTACVADR